MPPLPGEASKVMSEEKPTFKVTDRRLFNPDGTPRDIERAEEITTEASAGAQSAGSAGTGETRAAQPSSAGATTADTATEQAAEASARPSAAPAEEETYAAATDPTDFSNLVMFLASPAAAALGLTEHPASGRREVDLPLAQHCIDLLATLRDKTQGRLSHEEQQTLEGLLAELRMQFVALQRAPRAPSGGPRGFTGGDITGGR